jgi:MFS family permease
MLVSFQSSLNVKNPYMVYSLLSAVLTLVSVVISLLIPSKQRLIRRNQPPASNTLTKFFSSWIYEIASISNKLTILLIVCRGMISFASCTLVWTLLAFAPIRDFGLQLTALHVGVLFMMYGFISFVVQFLLFSRVAGKLGLRGTFIFGGFIAIIQLLLFPLTPMPYWGAGFQKTSSSTPFVVVFLFVEVTLYAISEIVRPALDTMIVNTSDLDKQGVVQGVSRMSHVFADAVGSVIIGWLYSYFMYRGNAFYVFVFSATFYLIPVFVVYLLPDSIEVHKSSTLMDKRSNVVSSMGVAIRTAPIQEIGI